MNIFPLFITTFLFVFSCTYDNSPSEENRSTVKNEKENVPEEIKAPINEKNVMPTPNNPPASQKPNFWDSKENWGSDFQTVDYSSKTSLFNDNRVNQIYKNALPDFTKEYVLLRVSHGHSCWIYSALIVLISELIESGKDNFLKGIEKIAQLGEENKKYPHFKQFADSGKLQKFIDALSHIQKKMDLKEALDFINHKHVEEILNEGLRTYIAADKRRGNQVEATKLENDPTCWAYAPDATFLASLTNVKLIGFYFTGKKGIRVEGFFDELSAYPEIIKLEEQDERYSQGLDKEVSEKEWKKARITATNKYLSTNPNRPKAIFFRSDDAYMDVAVLKSVAEALNKQ